VAYLALGTIGSNFLNGIVNQYIPSYVSDNLPPYVVNAIMARSFNNVVVMLVPSPMTMYNMTKLTFKSIYLVFKGVKYVVVKVKDMELIEGIIDFMTNKSQKKEDPILNLVGDQPLTSYVVDEDYSGDNRKDFTDKFTHPSVSKNNNTSFYYNDFKVVGNNNENETKNYEYLSSVLRNRNDINEPRIFEVPKQEVKKILSNFEYEKINLKKGQNVQINIPEEEKYPELLDLLSESITASWIKVPVDVQNYDINNIPKYPISMEDSWVTVNPTAPPIFDQ